jgi:hypothetical protein
VWPRGQFLCKTRVCLGGEHSPLVEMKHRFVPSPN